MTTLEERLAALAPRARETINGIAVPNGTEVHPRSHVRALPEESTESRPKSEACLDAERNAGHPNPATAPKAGDVVAWLHGTAIQIGAVQNIGTDGRVWVRRLDQPRNAIPQPPEALTTLHTLQSLTTHAAHALTKDTAA